MRRLLTGIVVALAAVCLSCSAAAAQTPFGQSLFGPFAGYVSYGHVHQTSAVITVPTIGHRSRFAVAATWIGVEGEGTSSKVDSGPFFQIGVIESQDALLKPDPDRYQAFVSSTRLGFRPRMLFKVQAGEQVRLSIRFASHGRLILSAADQTPGAPASDSSTVTFHPGRGVHFNQALWVQEDPTDAITGGQLPYPGLTSARFTNVLVDEQAPDLLALEPTWLSRKARIFGPTPLRASGFAVQREHPSAEALRYERLVVPEDDAAVAFDARTALWTTRTSPRTIGSVAGAFAQALERNIRSLRGEHWSANVRRLIGKLAAASNRDRLAVLALTKATPAHLPQALRVLKRAFAAQPLSVYSLLIKARLHIPRFNPSGLALARYIKQHGG
jgi:hypothetical protein